MMWFCLVGIFLIFLIYGIVMNRYSPPDFSGKITVSGRVVKKEIRNGRLILYIKNTKVLSEKSGGSAEEKSKGFICYMKEKEEGEPLLSEGAPIGSRVVMYGEVSLCKKATNPGEFDAFSYYGARGYYYTLFDAYCKKSRGGNNVLEWLSLLRENCVKVLLSAFGERDGGILCAMLFGDKRNLSEELKEIYSASGIAHVLAISGLHISLIGVFLYAVANRSFLSSKQSFAAVVAALVLYGFMVGYAPSVFRAVFMFSYRLFAKTLKKSYDAPTALSLSAFLTCLFFPGMTKDSAFLLTYLAVAGILLIAPVFMSTVNRRKNFFDTFGVSVSVFAATLPVTVFSTEKITFGGMLLNLVVLPAMPVLFVVAFLNVIFHRLTPVSSLLVTVGRSILFAIESAGDFMTRIPFLSLCIKAPGKERVIIYTTLVVLLCIFFLALKRKLRLIYYRIMNRKILDEKGIAREETERGFLLAEIFYHVIFTGILVSLIVFLISSPKSTTITFLDVGQGDGIFIRTKEGKVFMIDGGSTSKNRIGEKIIEPYLGYEGEEEVDLWFLTHNDSDHVNGFLEVLKSDRIRIKRIAVSENARDDFEELADLAAQKGCEMIYLSAGDVIGSASAFGEETGAGNTSGETVPGRTTQRRVGDSFRFTVISPEKYKNYEDRNAASLVLYYEEGDLHIAFMGDSREEAEKSFEKFLVELPETNRGEIILKCAHHGSANGSNSEEFYEAVRPSVCIVSAGRNNVYGHPHREVKERIDRAGALLANTADHGAITVYRGITGKRRLRFFTS